jgi:xylitol oxidase
MKQIVYRNMPMDELKDNFMTIMSAGYSVSLFTDWTNRNINQVWIKYRADESNRASPDAEFFGSRLADVNVHPVEGQPAESCTDQMNLAGPWYERLPHFKMGFTPSAGVELQSEYFVPMEKGYEALMAVESMHEQITPHLFISEIRTIDGDDLWMSPCYKKPCVAIHTTWKQDWPAVRNLLSQMEEKLAPFDARPHWGKLFTISPAVLKKRIERLPDFLELCRRFDPSRKFVNEFLSDNVFDV